MGRLQERGQVLVRFEAQVIVRVTDSKRMPPLADTTLASGGCTERQESKSAHKAKNKSAKLNCMDQKAPGKSVYRNKHQDSL